MSELQISLLGIGLAVIVAVYLYNFWLQRQYQRKYGDAFKQHEDALYHGIKPPHLDTLTDVAEVAKTVATEKPRVNAPDEACTLLDEATDYIVVIYPIGLPSADELDPLWERRFDFGKNVHACGQNAATGNWEKVIAESHVSYSAFKLALQLANRSGAVSAARLSDFRDLAREIGTHLQADMTVPDVDEAAARAVQLDAFCAEVDQMIGLNLLPNGEITLAAREVAQVAQSLGMSLQADGAFHLLDAHGYTLYSLCNIESAPFQHHTFNHMRVKGLTLLLDVPRVNHPASRFDDMLVLARRLSQELGATVVDDLRVLLSDASLAQIREQIVAIESRMLAGAIEPGSAKARRLFA
ncbi:MAG: cell division protein ZipA C-terminal FtsZ-binding domain-containing protein [Gallionellaceae bacterium]|nr:cell division protein ZipA C-terminal FtsZ-binding domain-containing protein [Gallionellaceae bacterium]